MATVIRLVLADDHTLFREGLRSLLERFPEVIVVGEATNGREVIDVVQATTPDIVLMDISMPEVDGLEATSTLTRMYPQVHVIILSMHGVGRFAEEAMRAGARGFLIKDVAAVELQEAIRVVMQGETYLCRSVAQEVFNEYRQHLRGNRAGGDQETSGRVLLPPRQRQILQLIAEGNTSKEIAAKLHLSDKTVDVHRARLMQRLKLHDVAGLVRYAIHHGLIKPDL
jgi:DNA-binding NarL/FixJ family response regulator